MKTKIVVLIACFNLASPAFSAMPPDWKGASVPWNEKTKVGILEFTINSDQKGFLKLNGKIIEETQQKTLVPLANLPNHLVIGEYMATTFELLWYIRILDIKKDGSYEWKTQEVNYQPSHSAPPPTVQERNGMISILLPKGTDQVTGKVLTREWIYKGGAFSSRDIQRKK